MTSIRVDIVNDREVRLARLRSFRWYMDKFTIGSLLVVMSQGEGPDSQLRLPFAGLALLCHVSNKIAERFEAGLNNQ